ncbi:MAG TPA: hypothetical protein VM327_02705 [Candidatus Thermoplasmatota archaeon]|nr:hypothetical protein [Candidatus Thermoplasmatota archaeon]
MRRPMRLAVLAVLAALVVFPTAQALLITDTSQLRITGNLVAPPGEDLVLRAPAIRLDHADLRAGDGQDGAGQAAAGTAIGADGGAGGSIVLEGDVTCIASSLAAGKGGRGGDATAWGALDRPDAFARGGAGGDAGRIDGDASGCILWPARAGAGGSAQASAAPGDCAGAPGDAAADDRGNDTATLGRGTDAAAQAGNGGEGSRCGAQVGPGGTGGDAQAYGGTGGLASDFEGADGGNATAIAGTGGAGGGLCATDAAAFASAWDAGMRAAAAGGLGGKATAVGGDGGSGFSTGGDGGRAVAVSQGGPGGPGSRRGDDVIAPGSGGDVLPGTQARGGAGGGGAAGGGAGGAASVVTLRGADGAACTVARSAGPSTSAPVATGGQGSEESTGTDAHKGGSGKDSPGLGLVVLTLVFAALLMAGRRR